MKVLSFAIVVGLCAGLIAQFTWKMIYFPEPILPLILEVAAIVFLTGIVLKYIWESN